MDTPLLVAFGASGRVQALARELARRRRSTSEHRGVG